MTRSATSSTTALPATRRAAAVLALLALAALVLVPTVTPGVESSASAPLQIRGVQTPEPGPAAGRDADARPSAIVVQRSISLDRLPAPLAVVPAAVLVGSPQSLGVADGTVRKAVDGSLGGTASSRAPPLLAFTA